jgi:hypothetical protein
LIVEINDMFRVIFFWGQGIRATGKLGSELHGGESKKENQNRAKRLVYETLTELVELGHSAVVIEAAFGCPR